MPAARALAVVRGLWGSSHPGPTCVVSTLGLGLGLAAGLDLPRLLVLTAAVFLGQLSIGLSNDAVDAHRDATVGRTDKPIARGAVAARVAWLVAIGCLAAGVLLPFLLGWQVVVVHAVTLVSAWAYNLGLKATAISIVPFLVSFGLFPSLATLSTTAPQLAAPWASVAGAALGAAVHLTNVLPDLDADRRTGIRGLPHRLGGRTSALAAAVCVAAGALAVLLGSAGFDLSGVSVAAWIFFAAVLVADAAGVALALSRPSGRGVFRLVMLAALLLAGQLVVTGGTLTG